MLSNTEVNRHNRRRKKNRTITLTLILIVSILPTILCTVLFFRISKLQKQVNVLMSVVNEDGYYSEKLFNNEKYAFAAEPDNTRLHKDKTIDINLKDEKEDIIKSDIDNEKLYDKQQVDNIDTSDGDYITSDNKGQEQSREDIKGADDTPANNDVQDDHIDGPVIYDPLTRKVDGKYYGKKIYLTFDDGPSPITEEILEVLENYQVKATFFVIGKTDTWSKSIYQRIVNDGHTLGMHSFSHKYSTIYNSLEDFKKDFTKLLNLLYDTTGYKPNIYRFPGGSYNKVNKYGMEDFIRFLNNESVVYFDWNVDSGDASGLGYTKEQLIENVLNGIDNKKSAIILMHDEKSKQATLDSLPELLEELISEGAELLPLDNTVKPVQQIRASSVK